MPRGQSSGHRALAHLLAALSIATSKQAKEPILTTATNTNEMIRSAEEFVKLRTSESKEEQDRATHDNAELKTWNNIISKYPDYKEWVIHNKTIQIEILEDLTLDPDPKVRSAIARKRKISDKIFKLLSVDKDEDVRYALISNTNLTIDKLKAIEVADSAWLQEKLREKLESLNQAFE